MKKKPKQTECADCACELDVENDGLWVEGVDAVGQAASSEAAKLHMSRFHSLSPPMRGEGRGEGPKPTVRKATCQIGKLLFLAN